MVGYINMNWHGGTGTSVAENNPPILTSLPCPINLDGMQWVVASGGANVIVVEYTDTTFLGLNSYTMGTVTGLNPASNGQLWPPSGRTIIDGQTTKVFWSWINDIRMKKTTKTLNEYIPWRLGVEDEDRIVVLWPTSAIGSGSVLPQSKYLLINSKATDEYVEHPLLVDTLQFGEISQYGIFNGGNGEITFKCSVATKPTWTLTYTTGATADMNFDWLAFAATSTDNEIQYMLDQWTITGPIADAMAQTFLVDKFSQTNVTPGSKTTLYFDIDNDKPESHANVKFQFRSYVPDLTNPANSVLVMECDPNPFASFFGGYGPAPFGDIITKLEGPRWENCQRVPDQDVYNAIISAIRNNEAQTEPQEVIILELPGSTDVTATAVS